MMKKSDILAKISSFWFFYRWHPEVALRYLPIVEEIEKLDKETSILEVGSGGLGITPYLRRKVTGVDVKFDPPFHPFLKKIICSVTKLPFADSSFDVVVSVDTLEHLRKKERKKAIDEMIRVARKKMLAGVPCGKMSADEDSWLSRFDQKHRGRIFPFLKEHLRYGLPEENEISDMISISAKQYKKVVSIMVKGNENISLHRFLLKGYMNKSVLEDFFFRKILLFAIPWLRHMNKAPTYRKLFFIDII